LLEEQVSKKSKTFLLFFSILFFFTLGGIVFSDEENPITKDIIASAEKIIGIEFTDAERDSMSSDLFDQLKNFEAVRKFKLENSVMPALLFNPIPQGFIFPSVQHQLKFEEKNDVFLPKNIEELAFYSIGDLAWLIKNKKISSTDLTRMYLQRLKEYGPKLQSVIILTDELALKQAKKADDEIAAGNYRGMLHGIPYGVKDLLSTKNYNTTWGAVPYKDQYLDEDASIIKKLEEAGAVLTAKLTMGALAWGDVWFGGKTRNPWDTTQGSSGSSAGSASSVAAGLLPFAIGTETWGSIVSPSTICGITGLRPTYGRVSRTGAMALSWSMDKIGPICRTAEDCAIVLDVIKGLDGVDQTLYDVPFNYDSNKMLKDLKIGYLKNVFEEDYSFKKNDSISLDILRKNGAELIPFELPDFPVYDISFILSVESAAAFDELTLSGKDDLMVRQIRNAWPNVFRSARFIPAVEYINANRIRNLLIQKMHELIKNFDVVVVPSWQGKNLLLTNLTGHPSITVPNGFSDKGTPTSITFIGNLFEEGKIISAAKEFQNATDYHLKQPPNFSVKK
jgi:Asp-tRNA(Asn)/Glu-tRNA(Gln) amidotransferase A subunit family amidase